MAYTYAKTLHEIAQSLHDPSLQRLYGPDPIDESRRCAEINALRLENCVRDCGRWLGSVEAELVERLRALLDEDEERDGIPHRDLRNVAVALEQHADSLDGE